MKEVGSVLNIIITQNGFAGVPNGFYRLTLMVWATPSDLQRVVATCVFPTQEHFSFIYITHNMVFETYHTLAYCSFYCNTYLWCAHLMVALQLNARLTFTTCCSLESNARVATYHPGGLLSIYSPRLSDRPVSLWDLQFGTCWRWVPFEEKMGITRSKVSDWGH